MISSDGPDALTNHTSEFTKAMVRSHSGIFPVGHFENAGGISEVRVIRGDSNVTCLIKQNEENAPEILKYPVTLNPLSLERSGFSV